MSQVESASGSKFLLFAITCPFVAPRLSNRMRAVNLDGGEYIRCILYCVIQNGNTNLFTILLKSLVSSCAR